MRIQFEMDGGLAFFPGLSEPVVIDSATLPKEEAAKVENLVTASDFFALPVSELQSVKGADGYNYTITIDSNGNSRTMHLAEPIKEPQLQGLIRYLKKKAKELRA